MANIALQLGVGVLSPFLEVLFDKLSSPILRRFGYLFKVEDKLKRLELTLSKIQSLVGAAEMRQLRDPGLAMWLRELKDVAYEAEDVLDEFAAHAQSHYDIGKKIDQIQKRLADIATERRDLGSAEPLEEVLQQQIREMRTTSSLPTERCVIGRDTEKEKIMGILLDLSKSETSVAKDVFSVLPIVGMGGLGKTTLARLVYNDPKLPGFDLKIWVCVSNDFSVRRITEEIMESLSDDRSPRGFKSFNKLQCHLRSGLRAKKFLLVLDDVWSENRQEWEGLCAPLRYGEKGSVVMITTRSRKVAHIMGTMNPFLLERLSENHCCEILQSCAFLNNNRDQNPRLKEIARQIAERLKGVPLAAKTIGGLLHSNLDEDAWRNILHSDLWQLPQHGSDIMPVLRLSYQQMPAHLKLCFIYCSLFPKGHIFDKSTLVRIWMAQGFIQRQGKRRMEDIGDEYFDDLLCRSFIYKVNDNYQMHDLMHDLAQSVSVNECVILEGKTCEIPERILHCSVLSDSQFDDFESLYRLKSLRTFLYLGKPRPSRSNFSRVPEQFFERLRYMRVLDLRYSYIQDLPTSIGSLRQLRYLDLSYTKVRNLPTTVGDLFRLQTLRLFGCPISRLPECVSKLTNLRNVEGKPGLLSKISGLGSLINLQQLDRFEVSQETGRKLGELEKMSELRGRLHISNVENVINKQEASDAQLNEKQYLRALVFEWSSRTRADGPDREVLECLAPHSNLEILKIKGNYGADFPGWLMNKCLPNLENLSLVDCQPWKILPPLGELCLLKRLEIGAMSVEKLNPDFWGDKGFPSLEHLDISDMNEWDECLGVDNRELFPSLRRLAITDCPKLKVLPTLPPKLETLTISNLGLSVLPEMWGCDRFSSSLSPSSSAATTLSSPPSPLSDLSISRCSNLTSLREGLLQHNHGCLETLEIVDCNILESLPIDGFRSLTSLKSLTIERCPNLSPLPNDGGLPPSLRTLKVIGNNCSVSRNHFLLNQLRNLTNLSSLSILSSPNLESLSGDMLQSLRALETFTITGCDGLITLGIQVLTALRILVITCCPKLTSLTGDDGLPNSIPVRGITIRNCATLRSLPADLQRLESLEELEIQNSPMIYFSAHLLPSLKTLDIINCPQLAEQYKFGAPGRQSIPHVRIQIN